MGASSISSNSNFLGKRSRDSSCFNSMKRSKAFKSDLSHLDDGFSVEKASTFISLCDSLETYDKKSNSFKTQPLPAMSQTSCNSSTGKRSYVKINSRKLARMTRKSSSFRLHCSKICSVSREIIP